MAMWRYTFADLLTDQDIVDLELSGVSFDRRIIQPGTLRAQFAAPNPKQAALANLVKEGRTVCHVYRDADIWGTYLIWQNTPKSDAKGRITFDMVGATLESWLWHHWTKTRTFTQIDQSDIARTLLDDLKAGYAPYQAAADIGLTYTPGLSGVLRDRSYLLSEQTSVGQRLTELANAENGFEWLIRTWADASGVRKRLWDWALRFGQTTTDWVFSQPGNVLTWEYPRSAVDCGTAHWARGDTPQTDVTAKAEPLIVGPYPATDLLDAGWPWMDASTDHQGVIVADTLTAYAQQRRATHSGSIGIPVVTVRLPAHGGFSPNNIGDYARLTLVNDLWPLGDSNRPTFNHRWRVVGMEVTPGEGKQAGNDTGKLVFAEEG